MPSPAEKVDAQQTDEEDKKALIMLSSSTAICGPPSPLGKSCFIQFCLTYRFLFAEHNFYYLFVGFTHTLLGKAGDVFDGVFNALGDNAVATVELVT